MPGTIREASAAILIANLSHFVSVLFLYRLCLDHIAEKRNVQRALVPALLHTIAPAGVFLSAPYGESLFAALSFAGYLSYAYGRRQSASQHSLHRLWLLTSGLCFGLSCTVRSNGVFNGVLFAVDVARVIAFEPYPQQIIGNTVELSITLAAGLLVAAGFALPQYIAWRELCDPGTNAPTREWCTALPPSIYTFVQKHYWYVWRSLPHAL